MADFSPDKDLDLSFLYEIADGSDEFIVDSIGLFLEQTPLLLNTISDAINSADWATAASAAHKLKPNLGFFGMPLSQAKIQEVELACKTGAPDVASVLNKFNEVKATVNHNLLELQKIKTEKEASL